MRFRASCCVSSALLGGASLAIVKFGNVHWGQMFRRSHLVQCQDGLLPVGDGDGDGDGESLTNWSGTHAVEASQVLRPESTMAAEQLIEFAHRKRIPVRPMGSLLSPNGCGMTGAGEQQVSLAHCNRVLWVDPARLLVRVEAGISVAELTEQLRSCGLQLQNYASIDSQQVGGFVQAGAHGSGPRVPPVDAQVVAMRVATPAFGALELNLETAPRLFRLARVALGSLGLVTEVTLRCVPAHVLEERVTVLHHNLLSLGRHRQFLANNRHVKYLWLPQTDHVVVVTQNPVDGQTADVVLADRAIEEHERNLIDASERNTSVPLTEEIKRARQAAQQQHKPQPNDKRKIVVGEQGEQQQSAKTNSSREFDRGHVRLDEPVEEQPTAVQQSGVNNQLLAFQTLYRQLVPSARTANNVDNKVVASNNVTENVCQSFAGCRDLLLSLAPLDAAHVRRINRAELSFWEEVALESSVAPRRLPADQLLQFECGGQQLVSEVCFKVGTVDEPTGAELTYVRSLMHNARVRDWPQPSPIEMRWTSGSASLLSPASVSHADKQQRSLFAWVGTIMYLPSQNPAERQQIKDAFRRTREHAAADHWEDLQALEHWAKTEPDNCCQLQKILEARLGSSTLDQFARVQRLLDPHSVLSSSAAPIRQIFPFLSETENAEIV